MNPIRVASIIAAPVVVVVAGTMFWQARQSADDVFVTPAALVQVKVPELPMLAQQGLKVFEANCAACHGDLADGRSDLGPPLVHKIYEPGHHGDAAFYLAVAQGVRAHHWPFGNMPPVEGVSEEDVAKIFFFVRTLQRANGIY
ncbi:c-type cytochrome [Roseibium sp. MMSF_3544]|uniref:c-type cytochrome n=1 Tax=unclassified Roseibium TaxID=2629323 RepID=UPI00273DE536|nr:c-type cytochrome [Roseibium sp. MMSF_3544]